MEIKKLDSRINPRYATDGSAGIDLQASSAHGDLLDESTSVVIKPGQVVMIGTGLAINLQSNKIAAYVMPRSGTGCKQGLVPGNLVGLIDSDYQGEVRICLWNRGSTTQTIRGLDRIAQLVVVPVYHVEMIEVDEFHDCTVRGDGGFGSTGK